MDLWGEIKTGDEAPSSFQAPGKSGDHTQMFMVGLFLQFEIKKFRFRKLQIIRQIGLW